MSAVADAQLLISSRDEQDAIRLVGAAVQVAAIPGIMSVRARDLAAVRIRNLAANHPRSAEIFAAIVQHLEDDQ